MQVSWKCLHIKALILHAKAAIVSGHKDLCRIAGWKKSSEQLCSKIAHSCIICFDAAKTKICMKISANKHNRDLLFGKFFQKIRRAVMIHGNGDQSLEIIRVLGEYFFQDQSVAVTGKRIGIFWNCDRKFTYGIQIISDAVPESTIVKTVIPICIWQNNCNVKFFLWERGCHIVNFVSHLRSNFHDFCASFFADAFFTVKRFVNCGDCYSQFFCNIF